MYSVVADTKSWLGVSVSAEPPDTSIPNNPTVLSTVPGSPASGVLEAGDTILGVEGVSPRVDLIGPPVIDQIASRQPGTRVALSIERGGSEKVVNLTLSSYASKAYQAYAENSTGFPELGVEAADLTSQLRKKDGIAANRGAAIVGLVSGSPAEGAGMAVGDVIVSVDSHQVTDTQDFSDAEAVASSGSNVQIDYEKPNGQITVANVTISSYQEWPEITAL
jgi:S1-C subfamily serine protease